MSLDHGIELLKYGKHRDAVNFFLDILYDDPLCLPAIMYSGIGFTEMGMQEEALKALTFFTQRETGYSEAWEGLGCAYYRTKCFEQARDCFTRALELSPEENSVIRNLGLTCMVLQDEDKAYELLERAVSRDKKDYRSVYALSNLCIRTQKFIEAESLLESIKDDFFLPPDLKELVKSDYQKLKSMIQLHNGFAKKA
ncbi:MAG: tetratricopeptide repeat protein [Spirochaetales bacterium]|nr:tetratricopeptide repeat protein [Spirochaetales bacterium]